MQAIIITDYDDPEHPLDDNAQTLLSNQGVDLDDWDLMVFIPPEQCELQEIQKEIWNEKEEYYYEKTVKEMRPKNWAVESMVRDTVYQETWISPVSFAGKTWCLGVKYH